MTNGRRRHPQPLARRRAPAEGADATQLSAPPDETQPDKTQIDDIQQNLNDPIEERSVVLDPPDMNQFRRHGDSTLSKLLSAESPADREALASQNKLDQQPAPPQPEPEQLSTPSAAPAAEPISTDLQAQPLAPEDGRSPENESDTAEAGPGAAEAPGSVDLQDSEDSVSTVEVTALIDGVDELQAAAGEPAPSSWDEAIPDEDLLRLPASDEGFSIYTPGGIPPLLQIPADRGEDVSFDAPVAPPPQPTIAGMEPLLFGFQFRVKPSHAPTPEEAAEQNQSEGAPSRVARIGRRSELTRPGRTPRPHPLPESGEELPSAEITPDPFSSLEAVPDLLQPTFDRADLEEPADEAAYPLERGESGATETAEERSGRSRRRKDRSRPRRRERSGMPVSPSEEPVMEAAEEIEPAAEDLEELEPEPPVSRFQDDEQTAEAEALARISLDQRLGKEIFVNTGARETRIAYLVGGGLTELHLEREERLVGAICKARVDRVLPGIDAAFVDVGLDRNAFLMASDVTPEVDEDEGPPSRRSSRNLSISELVKPRQEIMVQISKAPHSTKGARVSTRISLPGRYLVLMPDVETTGVSRKIDDDAERDRLKKIARQIRPSGFGIIVRTEAENKTEEELRNDVEFLLRLWSQVQAKYRTTRGAAIVHRDLSLTFKIIRDLFGSDVNRFVIDSREEYEKVMDLVDIISPRMRPRVLLYEEPIPLFERLGIEAEIERLFRNKVWLKSGGWLAIDQTEALTSIDVNSGKYVGTSNPAQTIFKINMEAVAEICRQLRLRDIGGMIILDLIDMSNARDRAAVMKALEMGLKKDRSRTKIAHLSPLGLVEMTRKRSGETFHELTTEPCLYCGGRGRTLNPDTVSILAEREIEKRALEMDDEAFLVMVHPAVAPYLIGPESSNVDRLERETRRAVYIRSTDNLHIEKFEVLPADIQEVERQLLPYREGQVVDCIVEQTPAANPPHAVARMDGYILDLANGGQYLGRRVRARLLKVGRSMATAEVVGVGRPVDKLGGV